MHVLCSGKGSPTVVLVAGGGAFAIDWNLIQSRTDSITRVCSYDQAGLGWSDSGPLDETVEQTVSDLHKLLKAVGEKGPFLLVGASIGGIFIQAYQHEYPDEVAGLIFSNSSNRIGLATKNKTSLLWDLTEDEIRSMYPFPPPDDPKPTKVVEPFDKLPPNLQGMRLWLTVQLWNKWKTSPSGPESTLSWRKEFLREFGETDKGKKYPLVKLPVVVVSSDSMANDSVLYSREEAAPRLDYLSSNSIHIIAEGSGHEIHLYQPDKVVESLKRAIIAVRKGIPLSSVPE
jgi:pimeloyl-ACP methyl ester carboxylesterase